MTLMIVGGAHTTILHHTQWLEALGGLLVGTLAALAALVVGQHCALLLYHKLNPGAFIPYGSPAPEQNKLEGLDQGIDEHAGEGLAGEEWGQEPDDLGRQELRTVSSITRGSMTVVVVDGGQEQQQQQWAAGQRLHSLTSFSHQQQQPCHTEQRLHSLTSFNQQQRKPKQEKQQQQQDGTGVQMPEGQPGMSSSIPPQQELQLAQTGTPPAATTAAAAAAAAADGLQPQLEQHQANAAGPAAAAVGQAGAVTARSAGDDVSESKYEEVMEEEEEAPSRSLQHMLVDGFAALSIAILSGGPGWARVGEGGRGWESNS
jgi:hypothetical protein